MRNKIAVAFCAMLIVAGAIYYTGPVSDTPSLDSREPRGGSVTEMSTESDVQVSGVTQVEELPKRIVTEGPSVQVDTTIKFDNGREVAVTLKRGPSETLYFEPPYRFVDIYDDLIIAANSGETRAAIQMFTHLKTCGKAPKSEEEFNRMLSLATDDGVITTFGGPEPTMELPVGFDMARYESTLRGMWALCEGLPQSSFEDYQKWARLAANSGDFWGFRFLAEDVGWSLESHDLWLEAWDHGHISAATSLALYYRDGIPEEPGFETDLTKVYAFQLVRFKMYEAAASFSTIETSHRLQAMYDAVHATGMKLSPADQEEAEHFAADLIEANNECCWGSWSLDK